MKTLVCYKREWEETYIFDVIMSDDLEVAKASVQNEYEADKAKYCGDEFQYHIEIWQGRQQAGHLQFNKRAGEFDTYVDY